MSEPQRALISTISAGQEAIDSASSLLNEKAKLPPLGSDPASVKWKETQWNTNQQAVHSQVRYTHISILPYFSPVFQKYFLCLTNISTIFDIFEKLLLRKNILFYYLIPYKTPSNILLLQVSAMNAATAQMVTLTGQDSTDHNAVGAAVNTISTNLPDMAREVKMLAALMDDKGVEGDDLMTAAKTLCGAFSDMLTSAAPQTTEVSSDPGYQTFPDSPNNAMPVQCPPGFYQVVKINSNCVI